MWIFPDHTESPPVVDTFAVPATSITDNDSLTSTPVQFQWNGQYCSQRRPNQFSFLYRNIFNPHVPCTFTMTLICRDYSLQSHGETSLQCHTCTPQHTSLPRMSLDRGQHTFLQCSVITCTVTCSSHRRTPSSLQHSLQCCVLNINPSLIPKILKIFY